MSAVQTIAAVAEQHSDQLLADSIRIIDATLARIPADSDEARAQRLVRASLYSVLETRHPHVIAALDEWATAPDGSDNRSYTEVILGTLGL